MCEINEKIDKIFGRSSFSFGSKEGHLVQWTSGSVGVLVRWTFMPMIGSKSMLSIWPVLDRLPLLGILSVLDILPLWGIWSVLDMWHMLGIWSHMYQAPESVTDDQASDLPASGSNGLG